jgi:chromosome segregation protein
MRFSKLTLTGFKSFVDPTDLIISPGMTGVVGPNGCGKSNLVEALRWVMGENSARKIRGTEMDDVIFGGTATRPARNFAEVALHMDNSERTAMAEFNNDDTLVVSRRIDRGEGSAYRVNGKPARMQDVKLLFADQATGAHSASLVSQGQIGLLVSAKPQDRRQVLEEAAGISGLHARRHEAELRLKAAETNLTRVDDVLRALDGQLQNLKKQVRQTSRYKTLNAELRRVEAALLHVRWLEAEQNKVASQTAMAEAEHSVQERTSTVAQLTTDRTESAATLPALRTTEQEAAAEVQKYVIASQSLTLEESRVRDTITAHKKRIEQGISDKAREDGLLRDADSALSRLAAEKADLTDRHTRLTADLPALESTLSSLGESVGLLDKTLSDLMQQAAKAEAEQNSLVGRIQSAQNRLDANRRRLDGLKAEQANLQAEIASRPDLTAAANAVAELEATLTARKDAVETAEAARRTAEQARQDARDAWQKTGSVYDKLRAEAEALSELLTQEDGLFAPLIDAVAVAPGFESAFAAAIGDALTAPLDEGAQVHWRSLPAYSNPQALPAGAEPLAVEITAPPALNRRLSQIGLVADAATGKALAEQLAPGQILVSRDGAAWRWDGYTVAAGAPTAAAIRLRQRNRLADLETQMVTAKAATDQAATILSQAEEAATQAQTQERQSRDAVTAALNALTDARTQHSKLAAAAAASASRLQALDEAITRLADETNQLDRERQDAEDLKSALPDIAALKAQTAEQRVELAEARGRQAECRSRRDQMLRDIDAASRRCQIIDQESKDWADRSAGSADRRAQLDARLALLDEELKALEQRPGEIAAERESVAALLADAQTRRSAAGDALAHAENAVAALDRVLKQEEERLIRAREDRVRGEAAIQAADANIQMLKDRITERLDAIPEELMGLAELTADAPLPNPEELESRFTRLSRERENMGPVNLRADEESSSVETEVEKLIAEKEDLTAAIGKLRHAIGTLNGEARGRLQEAFVAVDKNFQRLFTQMFGGGRAYLQLVEGADPLDAGLEIYASPPGKKLQALSLLSGGERALTALALLFAVFLVNPSPICVLDEVDAPLDEANVGRFCDLISDMTLGDRTRFLVITHHRLTMARMDRLFGVTMAERGVSQLVSVDLATAEEIRDAA